MENKGSNIRKFKVGDIIARVDLPIQKPIKYLGISDNKMKLQYLEWPDNDIGDGGKVTWKLGTKENYENGWELYTKPIRSESELKEENRQAVEKQMQEYRNREHERMMDNLNAIYDASLGKRDKHLENICRNYNPN